MPKKSMMSFAIFINKIKNMRKISLLILLLAFVILQIKAQSIIIDNGKANTDIVIAGDADSLTIKSAKVLSRYLEKITGVEVLVNNKKSKAGFHIFIGKEFLKGKNKKLLSEDLQDDAFLILGNNKELFLAGKNPQGNLYAVFTILEEYFGCMKFTVDEEYIPRKTSLISPKVHKVYNPAFPFRVPHFEGRWDKEFSQWHKISSFDDWGMFVHTFQRLVPSEKYFETHPEYFALVNGRRLKDGQLCLSNPDLVKLLIKNLGKEIANQPDKTYWSVSQNDCYNYCECEDCQALYEKYENISGAYVLMSNKIAIAYPDKQISTLAYQFTRSAPENIKPLDNVNIMFCSIECNRSMPLTEDTRSAGFVQDMKNWNKLTDNIFAWDYVVQFKNYLTPFPNFHVLQPNIRFFRDNGVNMMFQQGSGGSWSDLSDVKQYLIAKLLWNPELNNDSIIDHFINKYYGNAAPFIKEYYDLSHQYLIKNQQQQNLDIYGFPVFYYKSHLSPDLLIRYQELMNSAENAVSSDSVYLMRVLRTRIPADFAYLDIALNRDNEKIKWISKSSGKKEIDEKMLTKLDRFVELCILTGVEQINERNLKPEEYRDFTLRKLKWQIKDNKLKDSKIESLTKYSPKYQVGGESAINDGLLGGLDFHFNWLGYEGEDMVLNIDLREDKRFSMLQMNFLKAVNSWVFLPDEIKLEISNDGENYIEVCSSKDENTDNSYLVKSIPFILEFEQVESRYLKITATSMKTCPDWHRGFGKPSWIFVDEIILE